jgi:hypothetical protein
MQLECLHPWQSADEQAYKRCRRHFYKSISFLITHQLDGRMDTIVHSAITVTYGTRQPKLTVTAGKASNNAMDCAGCAMLQAQLVRGTRNEAYFVLS